MLLPGGAGDRGVVPVSAVALEPLGPRSSAGAPDRGVNDDLLCIDLIRRTLDTAAVGFELHLLGAVSSTSDVLRSLAEAGARDGAVVLAETQDAGRGECGRDWLALAHADVYASVLLRRRLPPSDVPAFVFVASLALADAIDAEGLRAEVRWPGNVMIGGRKVAGTLASVGGRATMVDYVILGVGVNVNGAGGPAESGATSLREAAGHPIDRNRFVGRFLNRLEQWLVVYTTQGPAAVLAAWKTRCRKRTDTAVVS
jgi:BirA family biotin operon repressor/biotin-[acetyl-CoA-carboxylase] ligase